MPTILGNPDAIYDSFETGISATKLDLSKSELEGFILKAIAKTLGASKSIDLNKTTDLFAFGVDSLQATRIRNICQKEQELDGKTLGRNSRLFCLRLIPLALILFVFQIVVYENPSIEKYVAILMTLFRINKSSTRRLANYIWAVRYGEHVAETDEHQHAKMLTMIDKWSSKFDLKQPASSHMHMPRPIYHVIVRSMLFQIIHFSLRHVFFCSGPYRRDGFFGRPHPSATSFLAFGVEGNLPFSS
jgi:hypothetical protein